MFRLRIGAADAGGPWAWDGGRWRCGTSWVEPLRHPLTAWRLVTDGARTAFLNAARGSGSCADPRPTDHDEAVAAALGGCDDWVLVEVGGPGGRVRVRTGTGGTAPVYLTAGQGALHGSWDLLELRRHATGLDVVEVARRLASAVRYTDATLWAGVHLLTERACATYASGRLSVRLPAPAPPAGPTDHPDPVAAFERLLGEAVRRVPWEAGLAAVELSGDLASANTALSLAADERGHGLTAAALVLDGEPGAQQVRRRRALLGYVGRGWADVTVAAVEHLPYAPGSLFERGAAVSPYEDLYLDAVDVVHAALERRGVRALFTGVGGRELMGGGGASRVRVPVWLGAAGREALREVDSGVAPASVVPARALMVAAGMAPPLLRRGLWPVHPLTDPALVALCAALPVGWRSQRRLLRERVERCALAPEVARPPLAEHFGAVMESAVRRHGARRIRRLLEGGSPLLEAGLLDPGALRSLADRLDAGGFERADQDVLFALLTESAVAPH